MRRRELSFLFFCCVVLFFAACDRTDLPPVNATGDGVAIKGYDPLGYFDWNMPVKGQEEFEYEWKGAKWRFSSMENLERFRANPEKYAPRYGGYCAYAVSRGTTADIDPEAWTIVEEKLYLNLNKKVQKLWRRDIRESIRKGDENWPGVLKK